MDKTTYRQRQGNKRLSLFSLKLFFKCLYIYFCQNILQFCGGIIAGLSLLTDSVMKLTMEGHEKECVECFLLPRRSLYIMRFSLSLNLLYFVHYYQVFISIFSYILAVLRDTSTITKSSNLRNHISRDDMYQKVDVSL